MNTENIKELKKNIISKRKEIDKLKQLIKSEKINSLRKGFIVGSISSQIIVCGIFLLERMF